jgi:hypothetical protein
VPIKRLWPAALLGVAGLVLTGADSGPGRPIGAARPPHVVGPPPGHTGGFGEPTCIECHIGSELNAPGSTLEVLGIGTEYVPGEPVEITVRIVSFDMLAAGFQAAFRYGEGPREGESAGILRSLGDRVAVVPDSAGTIYVQHTQSGVPTDGEMAEWTFEWTGPDDGRAVALHLAANSGNGDNSPLDDLVYTLGVRLEASSR